MNKLIEFNDPNGTVVAESEEVVTGSTVRGAGISQLTEKVGKSLVDTLSVIRPVAEAALGACGEIAALPDTVEVEFGLKFDVRIGAVIAHSSADCSMRIKLVWKPK
ncbi:MAG: CU044_2847 family protein [Telluria sp.]